MYVPSGEIMAFTNCRPVSNGGVVEVTVPPMTSPMTPGVDRTAFQLWYC